MTGGRLAKTGKNRIKVRARCQMDGAGGDGGICERKIHQGLQEADEAGGQCVNGFLTGPAEG